MLYASLLGVCHQSMMMVSSAVKASSAAMASFDICSSSVMYIEVCRRLNLNIVGSHVGEDFLIWPQTRNLEELFKITSGHSLFGIVNGKCVNDPRSKASDINSNPLPWLEIATNRDIIGIALANLIRLYRKRASKANNGLLLSSPLRSVDNVVNFTAYP